MFYHNLKVNLHLTENCNYHCHYCFAKYDGRDMTFDDWKVVIDNLSDSKLVSAINLAGGEPLVYPDFMKVLEYGQSKGFTMSFISNGSLLAEGKGFSTRSAPLVSCIGISIDSFNAPTLKQIGRNTNKGKVLDVPKLESFLQECKRQNPEMTIKVNTVVSKWNQQEPIGSAIKDLGKDYGWSVDKWKILRAMPFGGDSSYCVTDEEFQRFVDINTKLCAVNGSIKIVPEETLEHAYIIVDNRGNLLNNTGGKNVTCGNLTEVSFAALLRKYPLNTSRYLAHS